MLLFESMVFEYIWFYPFKSFNIFHLSITESIEDLLHFTENFEEFLKKWTKFIAVFITIIAAMGMVISVLNFLGLFVVLVVDVLAVIAVVVVISEGVRYYQRRNRVTMYQALLERFY